MDTNSIPGSSLLMRAEQTQQVLSTAMMKRVASQQNKQWPGRVKLLQHRVIKSHIFETGEPSRGDKPPILH